jgi:DNA-binding GntR family transcriptional regulator
MNDEQIQVLATATRIACATITSPGQAALQASLTHACGVPARCPWEDKAAAHAAFFTALAGVANDPRVVTALKHGTKFTYDLMIVAGRVADGIVINSRWRMLAHLHAGNADEAALEMEKHLRILSFMVRLASSRTREPACKPHQGKPAPQSRLLARDVCKEKARPPNEIS